MEYINAEVIAVYPDKIRISVDNLEDFQLAEERLKVGSYLKISDNENAVLIAIIDNFSIEIINEPSGIGTSRKYILEANPLGLLREDKFERGGNTLTIPPQNVEPAHNDEIQKVFEESIEDRNKFTFSVLASNPEIQVPVDGNKFFNKHIAIVGSTGSGKSHTVAKIIQEAVCGKKSDFDGLNNSHIVIFDIHSEYAAAFPTANLIDISNLVLPYWMLNSEELQELFLDTEANDHNQRNVFKESIIKSRKDHFSGDDHNKERIHLDSPLFFEIDEILEYAKQKNNEMVSGSKTPKQGPLFGKLTNYVSRLENKINDKRLNFLLGPETKASTFESVLRQLLGYGDKKSNITIVDLSGIPFDVLSISVSLISRILFEYGYHYKRLKSNGNPNGQNDVPLLLVYEEAHKYVPNDNSAKYRSSKESIERIAKEGRKYGISLLLASQRPSEISETIFSQCNNFVALRLTNPNDQNYVKKLLPDTLEGVVNKMPTLEAGEALLIGDAVVLPSVVKISKCNPTPASADIPFWTLWKEEWHDLDIDAIKQLWESK